MTGTFRVLVNPPPATNLPPTCTPQATTMTVRELETLSLTAATRDPDGDPTLPLPVRWTLFSEIVATGPSYAFAPTLSGAYTIGCQAADAVGWGPITTTNIEVVPAATDLPPRDLLLSPRSLVITTDELPVHFTASVTDDSPQLTWVWSSTSPIGTVSTPIGMGTSSTAMLFDLPVGSYLVGVEVSDGVIGHMPLSTVTTLLVVDESAAGVDLDGDGYRTEGLPFDCDDGAPAIHPAAAEVCGNGRDDDCDGLQDEGFPVGCGYAVGDRDNDLVGDDVDNCPDHANPDQLDADLDGIGDACDLDLSCPGPCDDGNACTDDTCDPLTGVCRFVPNTAACDDHDPCTASDTCALGACVATPLLCPPLTECVGGLCVPTCVPDCAGRECGDDGCGGSCGGCPAGETCDAAGQCAAGLEIETCADLSACLGTHQADPDFCLRLAPPHVVSEYDQMVQCVQMQCPGFDQACVQWALAEPCRTEAEQCFGPIGCRSDSDCGAGLVCRSGQCVPPCVPECTGRECGDDGCGGSCGGCPAGEICDAAGQCAAGLEIQTCADLIACFNDHQSDPDFCLRLAPAHVVGEYDQMVQCVQNHCPEFEQTCVDWALGEPCRLEAEHCLGPVACNTDADCGGPPCIGGTCQPGQCNAPCDTGLPGLCAPGSWRCDGLATCQSTTSAGLEACDDGYDNDCDGAVDELECQYGLGVSCDDPQILAAGVTVITTFAGNGPSTPTDCGPSDADRVFRISVPTGGADLVLDVSRSSGVTYRLVSGDCQTGPGLCIGGACCNNACQCVAGETCGADGTCRPLGADPCLGVVCPAGMTCESGVCRPGGDPPPPSVDCQCTTVYTATLAEGDYHLVASHTDNTGPAANARIDFRLALSVGGVCLANDLDGDGFTVCDGDCDESRVDAYPGALERCDGLDNDCDAMADEGGEPCTVDGALGPCAMGVLSCATVPPGADPLCEPTWSPRTDWCDDGIDGDCDGAADALDPEGCVTRLSGDTCDDPIELGLGGHFEHDFAGLYLDLPMNQCTPEPNTSADLVYRFTLTTPSQVRIDPTRSVGVTFGLFEGECGLNLRDCSSPCNGQTSCWPMGEMWLMPGTYYLVAWASPEAPDPHVDFTLASRDMATLQCSVPDMDGDGVTLCDGDCADDDFGIAPGVPELCDGLDNDCDHQVDEGGGACATGMPGPCGLGWLACADFSEVCSPLYGATTDWCGDGLDSNCSGDETDCEVPPATLGESCLAPRVLSLGATVAGDLATATDELGSMCQPMSGPEHVFVIEAPALASSLWVDLTGSTGVMVELRFDDCEHGMMWSCNGPNPCPEGQCYMRVDVPAFPGRAYLIVEPLSWVPQGEARYQLELVGESNGQCLIPDGDTDGFTTCTNDCDDTNPDVFPGAPELCNGTDDDCDGATDELDGDCVVPDAHGPCALGRRACVAAAEVCEQVVQPRAELCATGVDEDCDGTVDEDTPENACTALPPGESCNNPIDLGAGGLFVADLTGHTVDVTNHCSPEPGTADLVYRFEVMEPSHLVLDPSPSVGVTFGLYRDFCGGPPDVCSSPCDGQNACWHWPSYPLSPGTYYLVATGAAWSPNPSVRFTAALIGMSGECSVPDMDGDGFTLCDGDCDDEDFGRAPNAPELCDGLDNDCDHQIDESGGACMTTSSGPCSFGRLVCVGATMACVPISAPTGIDWCGDTWDDDCSGDWADCTTPVPPLSEACNAPQPLPPGQRVTGDLAMASDDLPPIMGSPWPAAAERVFAIDVPLLAGARVRVDLTGSRGLLAELRVAGCESGMPYRPFEVVDCTEGCADAVLEVPPYFGSPAYLVVEPRDPGAAAGSAIYALRALVEVDGQCLNPDGDADGHTLCTFDCDDADPDIHPGATELCNELDDDCDGAVDEGACGGSGLSDGLLGYWPFDLGGEDLVAGRALDLMGGATIVPEPAALRGGALQLQSVDDYAVRRANDEDFDFGAADFTVQLWVSYDDLQGEQVLVEKFTNDSGPGWTLTRMGDSLQFYWWGGSVNTMPRPLVTHRYYHVVVRRAGSELQVFFDGAPIANATISTIEGSANPLLVGRRNSGDPRGFGTRGRIDELGIWGRALSDTEIDTLYGGGLGHPLMP